MLGEDGPAELLLGHDVLCHLGIEQRLLTPSRRHLDAHHGVICSDGQLPLQSLFVNRASVEDHCGRHRVGRHLAPRASHEDAIGAGKCLGCHVTLAVRGVRRVDGRVRIGQQGAARNGSRRRERADGSRRLFHDHVDVGVAVPRKLQFDVANECLIDTGSEVGGLVCMSRFLQRVDGRFRQPGCPRENLPLVGGPFVRQHSWAGPAERGHVV